MKTLNQLAVIIAACTAITPFAFAQDATPSPSPSGTPSVTGTACGADQGKQGRHRGGAQRMKRLAEELNLTDQQQTQLRELFKAHRPELQAIRQDQSLSVEQKKEKVKLVFAGIKEQAKSFLTPEQQQKWDQIKERRGHQKS